MPTTSCNTLADQEMSVMHGGAPSWPKKSQSHTPNPICLPVDPMTSASDTAFQITNRIYTHMGHAF